MKTKLLQLAQGIFIQRDNDAVDILTTTDGEAVTPDEGNVLTRNRVSVQQFADIVNNVAPDSKGALVNVGTPEIPLLLTQAQAPRFQALLAAVGDPSQIKGIVNVGGDDDTLLLTPEQAERFTAILATRTEGAAGEREAIVRADIAKTTAAEQQKANNARINVGADYGLELLLLPGQAETFRLILDSAIDAAINKLTEPART